METVLEAGGVGEEAISAGGPDADGVRGENVDMVSPHAAPAPRNTPLETLTSGQRKEIKGGSLQAHVCVVATADDVKEVMDAFHEADAFRHVISWTYAYRLAEQLPGSSRSEIHESCEDGLDENAGDRVLAVLRHFALHGLLLVISRWQDYGATPGLELFGTSLYSIVSERCKDLITHLKRAVGIGEADPFGFGGEKNLLRLPEPVRQPHLPPKPRVFDFNFLPPLKEPKPPMRFGPNHFMSDMALSRPSSLPCLFTGGDVRLWMENDRCLRELPEAEIWALRSLRQPDERIERVLQAVAVVRGQKVVRSGNPAARWGHCIQVLRSPTFRTELLLLDAAALPLQAAHAASQLIEGLDVVELRRISPAAAALYEWVSGVSRWRIFGPPPEEVEMPEMMPLEPLAPKEMSPLGLQRRSHGPALRVGPPRCLRLRRRAPSIGMVLTR